MDADITSGRKGGMESRALARPGPGKERSTFWDEQSLRPELGAGWNLGGSQRQRGALPVAQAGFWRCPIPSDVGVPDSQDLALFPEKSWDLRDDCLCNN